MNKLEIDTKNRKYYLNGKPIENATKITITLTPDSVPEVSITVNSDIKLSVSDLKLTYS